MGKIACSEPVWQHVYRPCRGMIHYGLSCCVLLTLQILPMPVNKLLCDHILLYDIFCWNHVLFTSGWISRRCVLDTTDHGAHTWYFLGNAPSARFRRPSCVRKVLLLLQNESNCLIIYTFSKTIRQLPPMKLFDEVEKSHLNFISSRKKFMQNC